MDFSLEVGCAPRNIQESQGRIQPGGRQLQEHSGIDLTILAAQVQEIPEMVLPLPDAGRGTGVAKACELILLNVEPSFFLENLVGDT